MEAITVKLRGGEYRIQFGGSLSAWLHGLLGGERAPRAVLLLVDENVQRLHGERMARALGEAGLAAETILVPAGEEAKSLEVYGRLCRQVLAARPDRRTPVVAFGGGVTGDLAGFVAATILRGLPLLQVPTTTLAQADSSVGGKVGLDHAEGKNLIGAFHQPRGVYVDPAFTATLGERDFRAGLYEVIKIGLALDGRFLDWLAGHWEEVAGRRPEALTQALYESCRLKARVVAEDEREEGPRQVLNFGHTVGHVLERLAGPHGLRHGEAVAWGMVAGLFLSEGMGLLRAGEAERWRGFIVGRGPLPLIPRPDRREFLRLLESDKKREGGGPTLVLLGGVGQAVVCRDVSPQQIWEACGQAMGLGEERLRLPEGGPAGPRGLPDGGRRAKPPVRSSG